MKRGRARFTAVLLGALLPMTIGAGALADTPPNAWDRARDPAVGDRYRLHVRVQELMNPPGPTIKALRNVLLERARAELEAASAATSPDVRLRFDLGEVYEDLERYNEAIDVLKPALAEAPRESASADAWLALAFAAARLDRSREERDAYDAFLALSLRDRAVDNVMSNRAEAEMRLGNLNEAVAGYRDVIERIEHSVFGRSADYEILVLARWGLAVALDRNGDPAAAEQEAFVAAQQDPEERIIGNQDGVFFVPPYERDWYYGLGRAERAKHETDPRRSAQLWDLVVQTWRDYLSRAAPSEKWLPLARAHLASATTQRAAAVGRFETTRHGKGRAKPGGAESEIKWPTMATGQGRHS